MFTASSPFAHNIFLLLVTRGLKEVDALRRAKSLRIEAKEGHHACVASNWFMGMWDEG
ncbi:hypothetical protein SESBI_21067 [Sesbania bispinosa]|nr:hypothetical protein SESBI_21067 [Sesbania bispinosa]